MGDQLIARPLPTQDNTNTTLTHTSMHLVGFEPTLPVFEREKTVYAVDCVAAVISLLI
jgi:hypothetical protein